MTTPDAPQGGAPHAPTASARPENRLARERSPYLLQHARNPVDWYPWGEEAFARARAEDRPVFLSVGYSACHWCHVMERESFEDDEVAALLNARFVSVKVDREERPDVDEVYMRVTQMLTGHGGWPMTVFMTPDKRPFFAGTYFPREPRFGTIGFLTLLRKIDEAWRTRRPEVEESASEIARGAAQAGLADEMALPPGATLSADLAGAVAGALARRFDAAEGGFGGAPKFPPHQILRLLVGERARAGEDGLRMARLTLDRMAAGGIHDHVGGGFHRYSVDAEWHVPHFEKMLYDNAQLARVYVDAFEATREPAYREAALGIFAWTAREMTDERGGFHSALDADSEGEEGKFYLWTPSETAAVLGAERAAAFDAAYDVTREGSWEHGRSIPRLSRSGAKVGALAAEREALRRAREARPRPGLDDKVLAGWNGLMIGALARGGGVLEEPRLLEAAARAARFVRAEMRDGRGRLLRAWRRGEAGVPAFLEDHAFLADGLLDLHEASGEGAWLEAARGLGEAILRDFEDGERGGFFSSAHDAEPLLFRSKEPFDGAVPNDGAVATRVMVRLWRATGEARWRDSADRALRAYGGAIRRAPSACATLVGALCLRGEVPAGAASGVAGAAAADGPATPLVGSPAAVTASAWLEGGPARAGASLALAARVRVPSPLHVAFPLLAVSTTADLPIEAGPPEASAPETAALPFADAPERVYRGAFLVRVPLRVLPSAAPGARGRVRLAVRYRACDDRACLPDAEVAVEVPVEVAP
jgi:hypothetical protein